MSSVNVRREKIPEIQRLISNQFLFCFTKEERQQFTYMTDIEHEWQFLDENKSRVEKEINNTPNHWSTFLYLILEHNVDLPTLNALQMTSLPTTFGQVHNYIFSRLQTEFPDGKMRFIFRFFSQPHCIHGVEVLDFNHFTHTIDLSAQALQNQSDSIFPLSLYAQVKLTTSEIGRWSIERDGSMFCLDNPEIIYPFVVGVDKYITQLKRTMNK